MNSCQTLTDDNFEFLTCIHAKVGYGRQTVFHVCLDLVGFGPREIGPAITANGNALVSTSVICGQKDQPGGGG